MSAGNSYPHSSCCRKVPYLKTRANSKIVFLYELTKQKICEIIIALVKRNQISTWPIWKSDFRIGHVEITKFFLRESIKIFLFVFMGFVEIVEIIFKKWKNLKVEIW